MGPRKNQAELHQLVIEPLREARPGLHAVRPDVALERDARATAIASATEQIIEVLSTLSSDSVRLRTYCAVAVASEMDHEALHFLDRSTREKWESTGRCGRCGRTWRSHGRAP